MSEEEGQEIEEDKQMDEPEARKEDISQYVTQEDNDNIDINK